MSSVTDSAAFLAVLGTLASLVCVAWCIFGVIVLAAVVANVIEDVRS